MDFEKWWDEVGSGILPTPEDDFESHAKNVCMHLFNAKWVKEDETILQNR